MTLTYLVLKWVHIIASAVALGHLAALSRLDLPPAADERALVAMLRRLRMGLRVALLPALATIFLTGVAMVGAPLTVPEGVDVRGAWVFAGMAVWSLLAAVGGGYVAVLVARMQTAARVGAPGGAREAGAASEASPPVDAVLLRLWRDCRRGAGAGLLVGIGAVVLMVLQPTW